MEPGPENEEAEKIKGIEDQGKSRREIHHRKADPWLTALFFTFWLVAGLFVTCLVHGEDLKDLPKLEGITLEEPEEQPGDDELTEVPYKTLRKALWYKDSLKTVAKYANDLEKEIEKREAYIKDLEKERKGLRNLAEEQVLKIQNQQSKLKTGLIIGGSIVGGFLIADLIINLVK